MNTVNRILSEIAVEGTSSEENSAHNIETLEVAHFDYDGFQVVRGEFFAHMYEPSITFNRNKLYVNSVCVRRLPDAEFVQVLVNSDAKMLIIRPCSEEEKDSFRWCSLSGDKRKPKQITCRVFFAKLIHLMEWNPDYRYKVLGKLIRSGSEYLFVFDLKAAEIYRRVLGEGKKEQTSRTPIYPVEWQNSFGLPVEEHRKQLKINIMDGYAVFSVHDQESVAKEIE